MPSAAGHAGAAGLTTSFADLHLNAEPSSSSRCNASIGASPTSTLPPGNSHKPAYFEGAQRLAARRGGAREVVDERRRHDELGRLRAICFCHR